MANAVAMAIAMTIAVGRVFYAQKFLLRVRRIANVANAMAAVAIAAIAAIAASNVMYEQCYLLKVLA